ncbi:MAG: hypothetical protein U1B80_09240, partial [Anaerolineaceae bacterium]|nr:hypothetical protein [Anaerolineaceae bacterium]
MTRQDQLPFLPLSYFFRKPAGITAAAAVLVFILYSVWVLSGRYEPAVENIVSSLFLILTGTAASFFAYRITRRVRDRNLRIGWMLIAAAFAATTIGELLWYAVSLQGKDPFPS